VSGASGIGGNLYDPGTGTFTVNPEGSAMRLTRDR
jgi:hypothetical protein